MQFFAKNFSNERLIHYYYIHFQLLKTFLCLCSMNLEKVFTNVTRDKLFSVFNNFSVSVCTKITCDSNRFHITTTNSNLGIYSWNNKFFTFFAKT